MPSGTGPGLPRQRVQQRIRCLAWRRPRRVQLVVDGVRHPCPLLGFQHRRDRPAASQLPCVRFSVALPPGRGGKRAADFTLEPGGLSVRENLLRLACGAGELWGLNDSLTSSPLEPRGLLLSVMRQKVGKERSQGAATPLAIPRQYYPPPKTATYGRSLSTCRLPSEKFRPRARPPAPAYGVRCSPRPRDASHRDWLSQTSSPETRPGSPDGGRRYPPRQAGAARHSNRSCRARKGGPPPAGERHPSRERWKKWRASRAGRRRPERPYGSQFFSLPPSYESPTEKVRPRARCRSALEDWVLLGKDRWRRPKNCATKQQALSARLRNPATNHRSLNAKPQASAPRPC